MNLGINGKCALVTGSSKNIGLSIAQSLAKEGVRVILVSRDHSLLEQALATLPRVDSDHLFCAIDLMGDSAIDDLKRFIDSTVERLDIVVHNLGGSLDLRDPFASADEWARVWNYNLGVAHNINRIYVPRMRDRKWGRIVHLSSLSAVTHLGYPSYVAAKCAVEGYVKSMSRLLSQDNVIMTALAPGPVSLPGRYYTSLAETDPEALENFFSNRLPIFRLAQPIEIADIVAMLCSERASFMPGAIVRVDGGGY
jgi:3-oxoacyl-[acyl-carrier protein] reductase